MDSFPEAAESHRVLEERLQAGLIAALRQRLAIIGDAELRTRDPAAQLAQLQEISERLTKYTRQLPPASDARLRHYLTQCSYSKALEHLEAAAT